MILSLALLLLASEATPVPMTAPVTLALDVAKAVGATVNRLGIDADPSVSADDLHEMTLALQGTKLFEIIAANEAKHVIHLRREGDTMHATLSMGGEQVWIGNVNWPTPPTDSESTTQSTETDTLRERLLRYQNQKISVRQVQGAPVMPAARQPRPALQIHPHGAGNGKIQLLLHLQATGHSSAVLRKRSVKTNLRKLLAIVP